MWQALIRFFRRKDPPAPAIDHRIAAAADDRELIRLAVEALRLRRPELAHVAYWRAVQVYVSQHQLMKALAVLNTILRFAPNDGNAHLMRIQMLEQVGRRRDAAVACREAAGLFAAHGDHPRAQWLLSHALELDPAPLPSIYPPLQIVLGTPSQDLEPAPEPSQTGMMELDLDLDLPPPDPLAEAHTSMSFDALPASLIGSEHEESARGYLSSSSIPEAATRAYDQSELTKLLQEA